MVLRRAPKCRLVLPEELHSLQDGFTDCITRFISSRPPQIVRTMREGAQGTTLAVCLTAWACLVELRVVKLLLGTMSQRATHASGTAMLIRKLRWPSGHTLHPVRARSRRITQRGYAAPIAISMCIHTVLPIMWASDGAPLGFKPPGDEVLGWLRLLHFAKVRHEKLLARVSKSAKATTRAPLSLMAEALAEKVRVVQQLRSTVTKPTGIPSRAHSRIIKLIRARFRTVTSRSTIDNDKPTPITLAVVKRTATVVMRGHGTLQTTRYGLELTDHLLILSLLLFTILWAGGPLTKAA
mmetsp:Transcript_49411/g.92408  ORF Transcript_49411/g.92408 Transcript_49411/m.92408 type:complete len:296 (-) Transcript_49411:330-1217(-)